MSRINELVKNQKEYFNKAETLDVNFRLRTLKKLRQLVIDHQDIILDALQKDLNKPFVEGYMSEIGMVLSDLNYTIRHLKRWSKTKKVKTPLAQFKSKSYLIKEPYGVTLIMSPWNYPFMLTFGPLISAIAAGNTCIIKPSEYSTKTSQVMEELINHNFDAKYLYVVCGDIEINKQVLQEKYDFIFFTGSPAVGKIVMSQAAQHLTPVVLELGGKSPVIVDDTANLEIAAKRIVFGKFLNAGQTCVAPDYLLIDNKIKNQFVTLLIKQIKAFYRDNYYQNTDFCKIISKRHFERLVKLIEGHKIIFGGQHQDHTIEPTILDNVRWDDQIMQTEIFGPILPIIEFTDKMEVLKTLQTKESPLAFYLFSKDKTFIKSALKLRFGGGCINDTIIHLASHELPFGGIGNSGMGNYHGKFGFETFTHLKSIVDKATWIDLPLRYAPYNKSKDKMIRRFLR